MTTITNATVSIPHISGNPEIKAAAIAVAKPDALKSMGSSVAVNNNVNAQVLGKVLVAVPSLEQLEELTDNSDFSDTEMRQVLEVVEKNIGKQSLESVLKFDPGAWEKHVGVLVAAIIAVNISRQASAGLKGTFAVMAAEGARAQGESIIAAGKAVMLSAITAAAVAGTMAMGGMAMNLKGQSQKHADISTNKRDAMNSRDRAGDMQAHLDKNNFVANPADKVKGFTVIDRSGKPREIALDPSGHTLTLQERTTLSDEIKSLNQKATRSDLASALNEKIFSKNIMLGQTMSAIGMSLSTMVGSIVRMEEYSQRQNEVEYQSTQTIARSMVEEQAQEVSQDNSMMQKLLEIYLQINQSRNAASSTIAGGKV